ncbi:hypothetical protein CN151_09710 [Sinorhizobium meliloti]|nr:hypothetical protein DU99_06570 [Sinorhizobium meliloti]ARS72534.1 hypothetical protein SMRU11_37590 [Sinorhizobium meliloti RU11/001]PST27927.1 hypothetical protein C7U62_08845 [Mesorhizobium loti]ASJ58872.1 hypothetical protein SMB554_06520 [Sinorhizobium meliloti]ASP51004.1 hypothetical protein CDO31_05085 [Sinorhizobium meliloti]
MRGDETSPIRCLPAGHRSPIACEFFSPRTWAGWIPVTSTGMREWGLRGYINVHLGIRAQSPDFRTAYGRCSEDGTLSSSSLCSSQGSSSAASAALKSLFAQGLGQAGFLWQAQE